MLNYPDLQHNDDICKGILAERKRCRYLINYQKSTKHIEKGTIIDIILDEMANSIDCGPTYSQVCEEK